ncbi:MAG TPA: hypothetical protein PKW95_02580 [bacterium]|nr:hypothetical protein [bacterium]
MKDINLQKITLYFVMILIAACTALVLAGMIIEFAKPDHLSEKVWKAVKWGWVIILGEFVAFFIALAKNAFGIRNTELAKSIARKWAQDTVKEATSIPSLNTLYQDNLDNLKLYFEEQGKKWLGTLEEEFKKQTLIESKNNELLKNWKPLPLPA